MTAFWKYDRFPYCLWGTVTKIHDHDSNLIETKEFGKGYYFKPFLILSDDLAKPIIESLKKLKNDKQIEEEKNYIKYKEKLDQIWSTIPLEER